MDPNNTLSFHKLSQTFKSMYVFLFGDQFRGEPYLSIAKLLFRELKDVSFDEACFGLMLLATYYKSNIKHTGKTVIDPVRY